MRKVTELQPFRNKSVTFLGYSFSRMVLEIDRENNMKPTTKMRGIAAQKVLALFALYIACLVAFPLLAQPEAVKISGRSVLEKTDSNGKMKQWKTAALFEIVTDAQSNWWMKLKAPTFQDHHEVYSKCDDELFRIRHLNDSLVGDKEVIAAGTVSKGVFPYDMTSTFGVLLWFAFTSQEYLARFEENIKVDMPAVWWPFPRFFLKAHAYSAELEFHDAAPRLPRKAHFFTKKINANPEKEILELNRSRSDGIYYARKSELRKINSVPEGILVREYKVISFTNFQGLTFPLHAQMEKRNPNSAIKERISIQVKDLKTVSKPTFKPKMPGKIVIEDNRFRTREKGEEFDYFSYPVTNGVWLERTHPHVITAHEDARRIAEKHGYQPRSRKFSLLLFALGNSVLFGFFLLRLIKKRKQR